MHLYSCTVDLDVPPKALCGHTALFPQREYTHPRFRFRFQTVCRKSRTNYNWTSSSSSFFQFLGTHRIEIQIPSKTTPNRSSWVVFCRGKNRYVDELHLRDPGHNPNYFGQIYCKRARALFYRNGPIPHRGSSCDTVRNSDESSVLFKRSCSPSYFAGAHKRLISQPSRTTLPISLLSFSPTTRILPPSRPTLQTATTLPTPRPLMRQPFCWIHLFLLKKGSGVAFLPTKLATRSVRHYDQDERATEGTVHWNPMGPKCEMQFRRPEGENSRTQTGFNTCMNDATR